MNSPHDKKINDRLNSLGLGAEDTKLSGLVNSLGMPSAGQEPSREDLNGVFRRSMQGLGIGAPTEYKRRGKCFAPGNASTLATEEPGLKAA